MPTLIKTNYTLERGTSGLYVVGFHISICKLITTGEIQRCADVREMSGAHWFVAEGQRGKIREIGEPK